MSATTRPQARSIAAISLLVVAASAGAAQAQNAEAELLFRDGDKMMARGDYAAACDAFESSNRIEPRAGTLIRLGDCREKNGQLASAWSAYSDALNRVKDGSKRRIALERVAAVEPRLTQLTIVVPDDSRVEGLVVTRGDETVVDALWNRGVPVDGGRYVISARAPGHEEWWTTIEVPAERGRVAVDVPALKLSPVAVVAGPVRRDDRREGRPSSFTGRRKVALGLVGVGLLAAGAGAAFGYQGKSLADDAHDRCPQVQCADHAQANDLLERSRSRMLMANVGYGVAATAGVGAAVLWLTGAPKRERARVAVRPLLSPGQAGAVVTGRF